MNVTERAIQLLQHEIGDNWREIVQEIGTENLRKRAGKELTSFVAYQNRGQGGMSQWRGNCSPKLIKDIIGYILDDKRYNGKDINNFTIIDPMSGSGTTKAVADALRLRALLYDLNPRPPQGLGNFDLLKQDIDDSADLIFLHPPYWSMIPYSGNVWGKEPHKSDLSHCSNYNEFMEKLNYIIKKLFLTLRKDGRLAILVGDIRKEGKFYSMATDIEKMGDFESFIVKAQYNCQSDHKVYHKPFIPIVTEYLLVFHKKDVFMIPFYKIKKQNCDLSIQDASQLTWFQLIRMTLESLGGTASLQKLYVQLENHPKAKKNRLHYQERIRATIYEHKEHFIISSKGVYQLNYSVA